MELSDFIDKQAAGIARSLSMPNVKTTTFDEEIKKNKSKKPVFRTRVFVIIDDISAEDYAEFINSILIANGDKTIIREVENWTKDGELIRVVDYTEKQADD